MQFPDLAVLTIFYKKPQEVTEYFESFIKTYGTLPARFYVLDNSENKECMEAIQSYEKVYPEQIQSFHLNENTGFARGMNFLCKQSDQEQLLILNPDVMFRVDFINPCLRELYHLEGGIVSPALADEQEKKYANYGPFYERKPYILWKIIYRLINPGRQMEVDWIQGACMFCYRSQFEEVGGFNEAYYLYTEDMELCREYYRRNWARRILKSVQIQHPRTINPIDKFRLIAANLKHYAPAESLRSFYNYWKLQGVLGRVSKDYVKALSQELYEKP